MKERLMIDTIINKESLYKQLNKVEVNHNIKYKPVSFLTFFKFKYKLTNKELSYLFNTDIRYINAKLESNSGIIYEKEYIKQGIKRIYNAEFIYDVIQLEFELELAYFHERKLLEELDWHIQLKHHFRFYTYDDKRNVVLRDKYDISKKIRQILNE